MSDNEQSDAAVERAMKLQAGTVLAREVDRLRAELAETRAADPLVAAVRALVRDGASAASVGRLAAELTTYRRSVRGDAPAESVSWNDLDRATATIRRVMPSDATTVICGADVEEVAREKLPDGAFRVTTRRRGDAPAEPPADDEPKPWHGGPTLSDPATVSEGWDKQAGHPTVDSVGWDLTFGARVTIGRDRERDEQTGAPLPATWTFHLSLFDRDGAAPCTASLTKDVTPEQVRSYGEQLIALAGAPAVELPVTLSSVDDVAAGPLTDQGALDRLCAILEALDDPMDSEYRCEDGRLWRDWCVPLGLVYDFAADVRDGTVQDRGKHEQIVRVARAAIEAARGGAR